MTYSPYKEKATMVQKIFGKSNNGTNKRKKKKKHMRLTGSLHIEGRLNEGPQLQRKHKDEIEAGQKQALTPEKDVMASTNQTPGGYKFAPLVASQQGRTNQYEPACFGISCPWSFPSHLGMSLHAVLQPWLCLSRSISQ